MLKKFYVGGMTCSACSSGIERAVKRLDGVKSASVSLILKTLTVDYDENVLTAEKIINTVEGLGYTASAEFKGQKDDTVKKLKIRFIVSAIFLIPLMLFCMGGEKLFPDLEHKYNLVIQLVITVIVMAINYKFFTSGFKAVKNLSPNMDTLVSLGSLSAFIYSLVVTVVLLNGKHLADHHVFYESAAMVLTLVTLGKWLEELSKRKTGAEIEKLTKMIPDTVTVLTGGEEKVIMTSELNEGDEIVLRAGDFSPIDGEVTEGYAGVDKSAITGESLPEETTVGGKVFSGSIVKTGYLHVKAEKVGGETFFSKIVDIVKTAGASKAPAQKFADKVSAVFVPVVTAIALVTFFVWLIVGTPYEAFKYGITVLVVSCPCALGLATPVAVMAATGKAASLGILYKDAESLQKTGKVKNVLLDKTATITEGAPKVTDFVNFSSEGNSKIFSVVSALEKESNHPLKNAITEFCGESEETVKNFEYVVGKGIIGEIDDKKYYLGNFKTLKNEKEFEGKTVITLSDGVDVLAAFGIADTIKEGSVLAISELNRADIYTVMITGDNQSAAKRVAEETGIKEYRAEVLPEGKAKEVEKYKEKGLTAFVGDGINDSPALKTANVGVAIGTGTDIAIESADVILVNGRLTSLCDAIKLGRKATKIIKGNLFWAFFYNVLFIPVAAGVFAFCGFTFTPDWAALCMSLSSLFVVTNALRVRSYNGNKERMTDKKKGENKMKIKVEGMMCAHCAGKVTEALSALSGVKSVKTDLKKKLAIIDGEAEEKAIKAAVEEAGYTYKGIVK